MENLILYNWPKIVSNSNGRVSKMLEILSHLTFRLLPENEEDFRYQISQQDWSGDTVFMNPPYGREIKDWIKKAYTESKRGATVVCLIPARTDTAYWHDYCFKGEVRFLRGRLSFSNKGTAPFPSAVVIFRGDK